MRRRWLTWLAVLGVSTAGLIRAEEPNAKPGDAVEAFRALKREYDEANKAFMQRLKEIGDKAVKEGKPVETLRLEDGPGPAFSPRFLELAEKFPQDAAGLDALLLAVQTGYFQEGPQGPNWSRSIAALRERDLAPADITKVVRTLASYDEDPAAHSFLRDLINNHPDR
jgi:hypothetical protein